MAALGWPAAMLLLVGALLRGWHWSGGRSLWIDEAALALNLRARDFAGLLRPLDFEQGAPVGFLWLTKACTVWWGDGERALRLWPLCASLLGLPLHAAVVRRLLPRAPALLALALLAVGDVPVYYAGECKQYSTDLLCALATLWGLAATPARPRAGWLAGWALGGAVLVWLSHPAPLLLAVAGVVLGVRTLRDGGSRAALAWLPVGAAWLLSFAGCWAVSLAAIRGNDYFRACWRACFVPWDRPGAILGWLLRRVPEVLREPGGFRWPWAYAPLVVLGIFELVRRRRVVLVVCLLPWALVLALAALQLYPCCIKFVLFLLPTLLMLIAAGVARLADWFPARRRGAAGLVLAAAVLADPALVAVGHLVTPRAVEELRPVLAGLQERRRAGDLIYLHPGAQYAWRYYAGRFGLPDEFTPAPFQPQRDDPPPSSDPPRDPSLVLGISARAHPERYQGDVARLAGRGRVWLVVSNTGYTQGGQPELATVLAAFRAAGRELDSVRAPGAAAHLFELR